MRTDARRVVHLCFHGIGRPGRELEAGEEQYWISADLFRRVLDLVLQRPWVRLSFDDGNSSDVDIALEELRGRGLTADHFVLAGRLDGPGSLSRAGVAELRSAGMRVGSHGMSHVPWRGLTQQQAATELETAREIISDVAGSRVDVAALPFGSYDRGTLKLLRAAGYSSVYSSDRNSANPQAFLQSRYSIHRNSTVDSLAKILDGPSMPRRIAGSAKSLVKGWRA